MSRVRFLGPGMPGLRWQGKGLTMSDMGARNTVARGLAEVRAAGSGSRGLLVIAVVFSTFVNLLMLTGPLYMLQVYDRVLGSRSEPTLVALSILATFLFLAMGLLDHARSRVLARVGARLQERLDRRVFEASLNRAAVSPDDAIALSAQRDLDSLQRYWASPVAAALIDLPWTPLFLLAIFVFHPSLGWLSVAGGAVLVLVALANQHFGKGPTLQANAATIAAERLSDRLKSEAEVLRALGMSDAAFRRWGAARSDALRAAMISADQSGGYNTATRTLRQFLQSAMLGLGAWLVLRGEVSAGAMIASSILMGRALAPIEQAVGQWAVLTRAREARERLSILLGQFQPKPHHTALPRPRALLEVEGLTIVQPGTNVTLLRGISFALKPGQALGIIGPSGAGKSTLGRALIGALHPFSGQIRLDGAVLEHFDPAVLGSYFGYLPQSVTLFDATVAENIARLALPPDDKKVVAAAEAAAAHDMIQRLPDGYDTKIVHSGQRLSGGQIQRIGLARALYGNPVLLVLDEPNSNLDNEGSTALNQAIRQVKQTGGAVIVIAHRPAAIQECELLLVLEDGKCRALGPRDEVLRGMVKNHTEIVRTTGTGGVS